MLVGLNPIVLIWGLGGDHNDFLMMFFVVLGFYLLLRAGAMPGVAAGARARPAEASRAMGGATRKCAGEARCCSRRAAGSAPGAAFVAAVAIKASAGILLPVVLAGAAAPPPRSPAGGARHGGGRVVLGVCQRDRVRPALPRPRTQGRLVTMVSMPNLIGLALGQGGETNAMRLLLSGLLVACVAACSVLA